MTARRPCLSPELLAALKEVGVRLQQSGDVSAELKTVLELLARVEPAFVVRADSEIAEAAGLHRRLPQPLLGRILAPRVSDAERLIQTPGLEYLFLFHRDGRLRETALLKITGGLPNPFLFAAVVWRLNDWATPVRQAAVRCANRSFPLTDASIVARSAAELLVRQASWNRWLDERATLDNVFSRTDVVEQLAEIITHEVRGPQASTLRYAFRMPAIDQHLEQILEEAKQPAVRAVALEALIDAKVAWPSGTTWQWIDKTMGRRRQIAVYSQRNLAEVSPRNALISNGLNDRSAIVRKVALGGVIRYLLGTDEARMLALPLVADRSRSVRERAQFILRQKQA